MSPVFCGSSLAQACPDLADAPTTRWSVQTEGCCDWLMTPCGERFYSTGINVLDGEIPKQPMPGHVGYEWQRYYVLVQA